MNHNGNPSARPEPAPAPAPEPVEQPASLRSIKYGRPPIDENSSGRRARLRHPARGAARN